MKLFIVAGEPSGDRIAADLAGRLMARESVDLVGVGGTELGSVGLKSIFPMSDLSVMGFTDVIKRLPLLLRRIAQTSKAILAESPDVVVFVDAQDFSYRVAKRLRRAGFSAPVFLYVAPTVWAWRPGRAAKIRGIYDEVLAVLPFEPAVMSRLGGPETHYVGHPGLAETAMARRQKPTRIALLPGSRQLELRTLLPLLKNSVAVLGADLAPYSLYIPTLPHLADQLREAVAGWARPVEVISDRGERSELYADTLLAIVCSGTATFELAVADVPMVITYVVDKRFARLYDRAGRRNVGLPNIIVDERFVPEIIQVGSNPDLLVEEARRLLTNPEARQAQIDGFERMRMRMSEGLPGAPREDAAERVLRRVGQRSSTGV